MKNPSGNIKVESDFSNYAAKAESKDAAGVDTTNPAAKSDLASLKTEVNKIDVEKRSTYSDVVKKVMYNRLDTNVNATDTKLPNTSGLVTKTKYDSERILKITLKMLVRRYLIVAD